MLFHLSIDAENPRLVAGVLARLMGGKATPFPPVAEGSWVAHGGDDRNTLVEVYPRGTLLVEGPEGVVGLPGPSSRRSAVHFALATPLTEAEVHAIARWEGWPVETHSRGGKFRVIEVWLEGARLAEILTPEMQKEYLESVRLDRWEAMLGEMGALQQGSLEPA
jgi:hypothetical protein